MFERFLVVCTGNICRSPIAEALLRAALPGKTVLSAGTAAMVGDGAHPLSVQVAAEHGLALDDHRAQQLTLPLLQHSDLVLTLDRSHNDWILRRYPQFRGKVHLLGRWRGDEDVPDPYGHPRAAYDQVYAQMSGHIADWLPRLK
jgi:protein-tyrosine phosphatase